MGYYVITGVRADHGSVVTFDTDDGKVLAVDHRPAQELLRLLEEGGAVDVYAEEWQLL